MSVRAKRTLLKTASRIRRAVVVFSLCAFALQGYLTQTHIHGITQRALTIVMSVGKLSPAHHPNGKYPGEPSEKDCPLCHLTAAFGLFAMSVVPSILPPTLLPRFVPIIPCPFLAKRCVSHNWNGRAPR